jgi:type II restriction enzyme
MDLQLPVRLAEAYRSPAQRVRVMSEHWAGKNAFCPACLRPIEATPGNTPARDFYCGTCAHAFELKSKQRAFGRKIVDGAWSSMSGRIREGTQPNLFLLTYTPAFAVSRLELVHRSYLTLPILERRKPLPSSARRSGWVGCNILIGDVPEDGRIAYVRNAQPVARHEVQWQWRRSGFLEAVEPKDRGWLVATMNCVRKLGTSEFSLQDVYAFEAKLQKQFPNNRHVRPKIRQQLQILRDRGWLTFESRGRYVISAE